MSREREMTRAQTQKREYPYCDLTEQTPHVFRTLCNVTSC